MSERVKKAFLKDDQLIIFLTVLEILIALAWGIIVSFLSVTLAVVIFVSLAIVILVVNNDLLDNRPLKAVQTKADDFRKRYF